MAKKVDQETATEEKNDLFVFSDEDENEEVIAKDEKEKEEEKEKDEEEKEEEQKEKEEEEDKEEEKLEDDPEGEEEEEEKKTDDSEKEQEQEEEEEEEEFFDKLIKDDSDKEEGKDDDAFDFSALKDNLEIDFQEGEDPKDVNTFTQKINNRIEAAKQEFNLSAFPEDTQKLITYFHQNKGDLMSMFENESIIGYQSVLAMEPQDRVALVIRNQLEKEKVAEDEIDEKIEERLKSFSTRELKDYSDKIADNAKSGIKSEMENIIGKQEQIAESSKAKAEQDAKEQGKKFLSLVDKSETFAGLKMTDKLKASLKRDQESGEIDKLVDSKDPETRLYAYMMKKYGKQINTQIEKRITEESRGAYNKAHEKHLNRLHKTKDDAKRKTAGHDTERKSTSKGWEASQIE